MKALAIALLALGYSCVGLGFTWAAAGQNGPEAALCLGGIFILGAGVAVWEVKQ